MCMCHHSPGSFMFNINECACAQERKKAKSGGCQKRMADLWYFLIVSWKRKSERQRCFLAHNCITNPIHPDACVHFRGQAIVGAYFQRSSMQAIWQEEHYSCGTLMAPRGPAKSSLFMFNVTTLTSWAQTSGHRKERERKHGHSAVQNINSQR